MADTKYMESTVFDVSLGSSVYKVYVGLGAGGVTSAVGIYNVLDYGAAKDGTTDDYTAIQSAIDAAVANGAGTVKIPAGQYKIGTGLSVVHSDTTKQLEIQARGADIVLDSGQSATVLGIGAAGSTTVNVIVNGGTWRMSSRDWDTTANETYGIKLVNANRCAVRDVIVLNCNYGIYLYGDSGGTAYNLIEMRRIADCLFPIYLTASVDGWSNENTFVGGQVSYSSALDAVDCSSGAGISCITPTNGNYIMNNNKFYGISLEMSKNHAGTKPTAVQVLGTYHEFNNLRTEHFDSPIFVGLSGTIASGSFSAQRNRIMQGYFTQHDFDNLVKHDTGAERLAFQFFGGQETALYGGSASYPVLRLRSSSSGYKGIELYESASTSPNFSVASSGEVACKGLTSSENLTVNNGAHISAAGNVYCTQVLVDQNVRYMSYNGTPNGNITAAKGSICSDYTNAVLYINTDGTTAWSDITALWDGHTELSDTAYTDLVIAPSNFKVPASSNPTEITWLTNLKAYSFATGEYIHLDGVQLPHGYVPGTDILAHVHFVPAADITDGEVVRFTLTYTITSPFYGFPATATVTTDFTNNAAWRASLSAGQAAAILSGTTVASANTPHLITTSGTIDGTSLALSSVLAGKLEYTASGTTYTGEAIVTSIDFHYQVNRLGSENEFTG